MIKRKKVIDSKIKSVLQLERKKIDLACESCGILTPTTSDVKSIICSSCVMLLVPPPETSKANESKEKRPRGWQFRKHYTSPSGIEYSFGKEVSKNEDNNSDNKGSTNVVEKLSDK